jgi:hypothetical protein
VERPGADYGHELGLIRPQGVQQRRGGGAEDSDSMLQLGLSQGRQGVGRRGELLWERARRASALDEPKPRRGALAVAAGV